MKYRYTGPSSGVTLADGTEVLLWPGSVVDLSRRRTITSKHWSR